MTPEEQYDEYITLHRNFSETYSKVYKHVMDFYPQPQKFIQDATPEIERYVEKFSACQNKPGDSDSFQDFFYFARNFKTFAANTTGVFEEYKGLYGESGNYIKTIFRLKEKSIETNADYIELIPVLSHLIMGFEQVRLKTDEASRNLRQLQSEWHSLKEKMSS